MNVLSLYDGMSCGRIALERVGIKVDKYYRSEIDKYANIIAKKNYPDSIDLGDVTGIIQVQDIDLLIGGSPCQGFSRAGKQLNFDDPRSKLFFEFVRLLKSCEPKYFLLENAVMKKEYQDVISEHLGVEPIMINSALVSAQNRKRLYWTNIPGVKQPEDKGILIRDILDNLGCNTFFNYRGFSPRETKNYIQFDVSGKGYNSQQDRAYLVDRKFGCFPNARAITKRKITDGDGLYRNLSLNECERLQTVPDNYTRLGEEFSLNKSLSVLGNGWTVDTIAHIFRGIE